MAEIISYNKNPFTGISYGAQEERGYLAQSADIPYLRFPAFDRFPELRHGYSTRLSGISTGYCSTMSFSEKCGDTPEQVRENFRRMSEAIGISPETLVLTDQIHEAAVIPVTEENCCDEYGRTTLQGVDGIVTNKPGITLVCFTADCVPLFFYDPKRTVIGLSHAGWRGTVKEIGAETLRVMRENYGTDPADVHVAVGPSICPSCYEVDGEVINAFRRIGSGKLARFVSAGKTENHYQLDLWQANKELLMLAGVPEAHISISGICTCCNRELLHSHRATGGKRGLLTGYLSLNKQAD